MTFIKKLSLVLTVTTLVAGCSYDPFSDDEYASLNRTRTRSSAAQQYGQLDSQIPVTKAVEPTRQQMKDLEVPDRPPPLGSTNFTPVSPAPISSTGTLVGVKVQQMREDLMLLQNSIADQNTILQEIRNEVKKNTQFYHTVVASISTRLQIGTTPGNPVLIEQWNQAQDQLEQIGRNVADMNNLSNSVAGSSTLSGYLMDSVQAAYTLSGAVDEDHRQLGILENDVKRTTVLVDRLLEELSRDISRQSSYLNSEKRNMTTLSLAIKNGELYGRSLSSVPQPPAAVAGRRSMPFISQGYRAVASAPILNDEPLVTIRFDRPNVSFERPLYEAVSQALERKPDVAFTLVSVAPYGAGSAAGYTAQQNTDRVLRSLSDMGVPSGRVTVAEIQAPDVSGDEVRLYVR